MDDLVLRTPIKEAPTNEQLNKQLAQESVTIQRALESACRPVTGRSYEEVNAELENTAHQYIYGTININTKARP